MRGILERGAVAIALVAVAGIAAGASASDAGGERYGETATARPLIVDEPTPQWHGRGVVRVTKIVTGDDAPTDVSFDICLTGPLPDGPERCKTMTGEGVITFHDLEPGTYTLAERDVPPGFEVSYSATEFVVVADRFTDVSVTNHFPDRSPPSTQPPPTTVESTTLPPTTVVARIAVTKLVTGADVPTDATYEICITGPLPADTTECAPVAPGDTTVFDGLVPGRYLVTEPDPGPGVEVTYSDGEIEVAAGVSATVTVTNDHAGVRSQPPPATTTTTSLPSSTTSTTAPPVAAPPQTLPATGSGDATIPLTVAAALALLGVVALAVARSRATGESSRQRLVGG